MPGNNEKFNLPIIIVIFAVAILFLYLLNTPSPFEDIENNEQVIENNEQVIENREPVVNEEPVPGIIAPAINEDCPYGKELKNTPENPMTYVCKLITLENGGEFGDVRLTINNERFQSPIQVKKGTTVTWVMNDKNVVDDGGIPSYYQVYEVNGLFDSGKLFFSEDNSKFSYTFNELGEFEYYCPAHPIMIGTIIVVE